LALVNAAGMTDRQIALDTLAQHGLAAAQVHARLDAFHALYLEEVARVQEQLSAELEVLPGVPALLERLAALGIAQAPLTGNFEATARIKLATVGLDHHLDFAIGAFGGDHHDRNELVPIALEKASRLRGLAVEPARVVILGDTPRDIACARAGGTRVVAVATGRYAAEALAPHQPDHLLASLADTDTALAAILGEGTTARA
jgi:phosphoglycolate phosphatase